jgi:hypothetical protein
VDFGATTGGGRAVAEIDILDDMSGYQVLLGAAAAVWHCARRLLPTLRWLDFIGTRFRA